VGNILTCRTWDPRLGWGSSRFSKRYSRKEKI